MRIIKACPVDERATQYRNEDMGTLVTSALEIMNHHGGLYFPSALRTRDNIFSADYCTAQ